MHRSIAALSLLVLTAGADPAVPSRALAGAPPDLATLEVDRGEARDAARMRKKALRAATKWARANPERFRMLVPPGASLEPGSFGSQFLDRMGEPRDAVLDSLQQTVVGLGYQARHAKDPEHLAGAYQRLHGLLPPPYRDGLPDPSQLVGKPRKKAQKAILQLGTRLVTDLTAIRNLITLTEVIPGLAVNPIGACDAEVGWEGGGADVESSDRCDVTDYASLGIMANVDFVLKDDLTCVKDQRARGTCVAHAVSANLESSILADGGSAENLAEQNLYFWAKIATDLAERYTDGLNPDEVYDALVNTSYRIPHEESWNYNQSPQRGAFAAATNTFPSSCDAGYTGEMCTDFSFQAQETLLLGFPVSYSFPAPAPADGWIVTHWGSFPEIPGLPDFQIDASIVALESDVPVHMSLTVPPSFRSPDANGYVQHVAGQVAGAGSHSVLAVGFVANADLPAGAPADPDGLGYFAIKNSWGTDYADCGFAYLSSEFVRNWVYAFRYIDPPTS